jgi:hypothetical protein
VNFSFHRRDLKKKTNSVFFLNNMAYALGTAVTNLDEAPIRINGFSLKNFLDSKNGLG